MTAANIPRLPGHAVRVVNLEAFQCECECGHLSTLCPETVAHIDGAFYEAGYPRQEQSA